MSSAPLSYSTINPEQVYTIHEAATELHTSRTLIAKLASRREITHENRDGRPYFLGKDLQELEVKLEEGRKHIAELFANEKHYEQQALEEIARRLP